MELKPGWKTTEFWLTAVAWIIGLLLASGALDGLAETHWAVKVVGIIGAALATLGYEASRAKVKGNGQ